MILKNTITKDVQNSDIGQEDVPYNELNNLFKLPGPIERVGSKDDEIILEDENSEDKV